MTSYHARLTALFPRWRHAGRKMFSYNLPATPAAELVPVAAQKAANDTWESEGGSVNGPRS